MQETSRPELKLLFAIMNGAHLGGNRRLTGWHLKQEGLKPGVPDLCLPVPRGHYHGLYIEMKNDEPKGILSDAQHEWLDALWAQDYCTDVCYGWEEARRIIERYLSLPRWAMRAQAHTASLSPNDQSCKDRGIEFSI